MIVLPETARAQVETELAVVEPWGRARGWVTTWRPEALHLEVRMRSGIDAEEYVFGFDLSDYRALPPLIELAHPKTAELGTRRCYPKGGRGYFHEQPVLCAPWSPHHYPVLSLSRRGVRDGCKSSIPPRWRSLPPMPGRSKSSVMPR